MDVKLRALERPVSELPMPRRPKTPRQVWENLEPSPLSHTDVRTELKMSSKQLEMEFKKELKSQL